MSRHSHIDGLRPIVAGIPDFKSEANANLDALRIYTGSHEISEMQEHIGASSVGKNESKAPVGIPPFQLSGGQPISPKSRPGGEAYWRYRGATSSLLQMALLAQVVGQYLLNIRRQ
jgi:hypothetical protein